MRLEPVDRPSSVLGRLMSWGMRLQLGKVITPARVFYNRVPRMWNVSWALIRLDMHGLEIPDSLALLIGLEKFRALGDWRESAVFVDRERAALAYAEEATRQRVVSDATFEELRKHFSQREIAEVTIVNAVENFYNFLNVPLEIPDDGLAALAQSRRGVANA